MGAMKGSWRRVRYRVSFNKQAVYQEAQELHRHGHQRAQELHHHSQHLQQAQELLRHTRIRVFTSQASPTPRPSISYLRRSSSPISESERACVFILLRRPPSEPIEITLQTAHFPLTSSNISLLLSRLRSPKDALRIFLIFLKSNPSLVPATAHLNAVSQFWLHEKERIPVFLGIILGLRKPNFVMTPRTLTAVIRGYGWAGLVDEVLNFLSTCERSFGFQPDFFHFSCALHICIEEKRLDVALQVFRQMDENGCSPTLDTFQSLIAGLLRAKRPRDASLLFVQFVSRRLLLPGELSPSLAGYITIVDALIRSGDYHQALLLVLEMNDNGYTPDCFTCTSILKAISTTHIAHPEAINSQALKEIYDEMKSKELLPNVTSLKDFVRVHCTEETSSKTKEMLYAMISTFEVVTSLRVSEKEETMETEKEDASSLKLSENEGSMNTEKELSDSERTIDTLKDDAAFRRVSENERTRDTKKESAEKETTVDTKNLNVGSPRVSEQEGTVDTENLNVECLRVSEQEGTVDPENSNVESPRVSEQEGTMKNEEESFENERAMNTEKEFSENDRSINTEKDDIASCRVSESERTLDSEKEISEIEITTDTDKLGLEPLRVSENEGTIDTHKEVVADLALFDHVIYSLAMHAKSADAYVLMLKMTENSGIPTKSTSMVLFDALSQSCKWLEAEHVLRMMMKWDYSPNLKTYNFWIQGACRDGHVDKVYLVLNEFTRDSLVLDTMSFNVVVDKLCLARKLEEAKKFAFELKKSLHILDVVTYCRMIYSFAKAGDFDVPRKLLGEMVEMGFVPFAQPFTPMIDNFCREGKMEVALSLLDELGKKGCNPISGLYTYIIRAYCDRNQLQDAFKVIDTMKSKGIAPEVKAHKVLFENCMVAQKFKPAVQRDAS